MTMPPPLPALATETDAGPHRWPGQRIAVVVPCYNEEVAIPHVIAAFRRALPEAEIYVFDNNSRDQTAAVARAAGAQVRRELRQGKGNVVRRAFADIEADVYLLVDGDDTYDASAAPAMVDLLIDQHLDMVNGARVTDIAAAYRPGHRLGNRVLTGLVRAVFGNEISDMLSGYRVFSRRFVKSFPSLASGFETETEFTVHALDLKMPVGEVPTRYKDRPEHVVLLKLATQLPLVDRVLVNAAIKKQLCDTVTGDRSWLHLVRPWYGHASHMHISFRCPAGQPECKNLPPPPADEDCGANLQWWFTRLDAKPGPAKPESKPPPPPKPPAACAAIMAAP